MVQRPLARLLALSLALLLLFAAGWPVAGTARPPGAATAAVATGHQNDAVAPGLLPAAEAPAAEGRQAAHAADSLADLPEALATQAGVATSNTTAAGRCASRSTVRAGPYLDGPQRPPCGAGTLA